MVELNGSVIMQLRIEHAWRQTVGGTYYVQQSVGEPLSCMMILHPEIFAATYDTLAVLIGQDLTVFYPIA